MLLGKVKLALILTYQALRHEGYGRVDVYSRIYMTSALAGGEWSASRPGRFTPGERAPGTYWIGGWVDSRA
jgi:hypothetical protein